MQLDIGKMGGGKNMMTAFFQYLDKKQFPLPGYEELQQEDGQENDIVSRLTASSEPCHIIYPENLKVSICRFKLSYFRTNKTRKIFLTFHWLRLNKIARVEFMFLF